MQELIHIFKHSSFHQFTNTAKEQNWSVVIRRFNISFLEKWGNVSVFPTHWETVSIYIYYKELLMDEQWFVLR